VILETGHLTPMTWQVKEARGYADESFCTMSSKVFCGNLPKVAGLHMADQPVLLKLRNVGPHEDPWVSGRPEEAPQDRRAIFWMLEGKSPLHLHVGTQAARLSPGDWVLFDDSIMHSVVCASPWRGAAFQLTPRVQRPISLPTAGALFSESDLCLLTKNKQRCIAGCAGT
jgi:hypothetical protein